MTFTVSFSTVMFVLSAIMLLVIGLWVYLTCVGETHVKRWEFIGMTALTVAYLVLANAAFYCADKFYEWNDDQNTEVVQATAESNTGADNITR